MDQELRSVGLGADGSVAWNDLTALPAAREYCHQFTLRHEENFSVISWFLPSSVRQHFCHLYAYCRGADDIADQVADPSMSLELLNWWQEQLEACYSGECRHPIFTALRETIAEYSLPPQPFLDLLTAFRRDQSQHEYHNFADLLSYCRCSANPVGRLILGLGRCASDDHVRLSDYVCTGLQLVNFCQDVSRDAMRGRIYIPQATREAFGYDDRMWSAREFNPRFRNLMRFEVDRAESYLLAGRPLVYSVPPAFRLQVGLFVEGGLAVVRAIRRLNYDVWSTRPVVGRFGRLLILRRTLTRRYGLAQWIVNFKPATRFAGK